jgi:radical SAM superfamily enzyme YgiQ (UPF0313 family)
MDVVLFNPAPRSGWQAQRRIELPLNLLCPATSLVNAGYSVRIIDQFADRDWKKELSKSLSTRPVCFGVSSMTGPQILRGLEASRIFKSRYPDVPVVWGGVHPSLLPEQTLKSPLVDIVVVGEGEVTLLELVRTLQEGGDLKDIPGIAYKDRDTGAYQYTGPRPFIDLNQQSPLAYHLVDVNKYRRHIFNADHVSFNSSRGCTFGCHFCWDPVIHKRQWRAMEPLVVMDHLKRFIRDYGIRGFNFTDDNFFVDIKRAHRILEEIVRADLGVSLGKLQVRADTVCKLENDFFDLMIRAGVKRLHIGVESGSQRILDFINKNEPIEKFLEANKKISSFPITPLYTFMMGLPTETIEEFAQSIRLATRLTDENPRAVKTFNIYTPYPGTRLYDKCVQMGLNPPERLEDWAGFNYRNIPRESTWISAETKKMIGALDFPLMFLGKGHFVNPYKKTNPLVVGLSRLYYPVARYRVTHLYDRFPIETKLIKALGLFGRQD